MALTPADIFGSLSRTRHTVLGQISRMLDRAIAIGEDAVQTAKRIGQYANPWYLTRRGQDGQLVRDQRVGIVRSWPGTAGLASYGHRRLTQWAIREAHRDAAIQATAASVPQYGLKWLVGHHGHGEVCEGYAERDSGFGRGIYLSSQFPAAPHGNCQCTEAIVPLAGAKARAGTRERRAA